MSQRMRLWYLSHRRPAKADEPTHPRSLARAFTVRTHEVRRKTKGPTKNQTSSPTGWLRMCVWSSRLRRTESAIISCIESNSLLLLHVHWAIIVAVQGTCFCVTSHQLLTVRLINVTKHTGNDGFTNCSFGFNVTFNSVSVIPRRCLVVTGSSFHNNSTSIKIICH